MPAPGSGAADTSSSASAIFEGRVSGHHVLHIENYSRTKERLPNHTSINSRPFRVGGYSWYLCYFPNGESSENADYISVFLCLEQSATGRVEALARLSLLDRAGKPVPSHTREAEVFEYAADESYGFFDFIKRDFLEASEHLKDDCFRIRCDIFIPEGLLTEDRAAFVDVPPSDMHQHFRDLLKSKDGADVTFRVGGEIFRAHRYILGARSPVFKAELLGTMRESTATEDCIQIDDMLPQVFKALLHFIYTDSWQEMKEQEEAMMAQHLLEPADRYDMKRLKLICENKLCNHLEVSTAATTLVLAEQHNCPGLKEACIEFLISPDALEAVMETDGFEHLTKSCPALVKELMSKLATRLYKRRKLSA
ncbi:unnamed protein product [Urochloa decumbens]|uniref:Uncharacterized protein n=1 Tax=Urochloa decumbens TaxID=240449 RepID=A0ABC8YG99_9POAL